MMKSSDKLETLRGTTEIKLESNRNSVKQAYRLRWTAGSWPPNLISVPPVLAFQ